MNMNIEEQICSIEMAAYLDKIGVRADSIFSYRTHLDPNSGEVFKWNLVFRDDGIDYDREINAYTVAELGEMLPDWFLTSKTFSDIAIGTHPPELASKIPAFEGNEVERRARTLIWLVEKGHEATNKLAGIRSN